MHGLKTSELKILDETLPEVIRYYSKESGVRSLEREIGALARKTLTKILKNSGTKSITVKPEDLEEFFGVKKYRFWSCRRGESNWYCNWSCIYRIWR